MRLLGQTFVLACIKVGEEVKAEGKRVEDHTELVQGSSGHP